MEQVSGLPPRAAAGGPPTPIGGGQLPQSPWRWGAGEHPLSALPPMRAMSNHNVAPPVASIDQTTPQVPSLTHGAAFIVRVAPNHCVLLNSRDKTPYLVYLEVVEPVDLASAQQVSLGHQACSATSRLPCAVLCRLRCDHLEGPRLQSYPQMPCRHLAMLLDMLPMQRYANR